MKSELTKQIESAAIREFQSTGIFICPEVGIPVKRYGFPKNYYRYMNLTEQEMLDKGWKKSWITNNEIVDILTWESNKNIWRCYEIKISYQDFKSSAAKTFVGNYNYYIIPDTLLDKVKEEVPENIGIYVYDTKPNDYRWYKYLTCYKKARKQDLQCDQKDLYYSIIKSLYREYQKYCKKSNLK